MSPKETMLVPIIVAMCFLPADIAITIGSLHFSGLRLLTLIGISKVFMNGHNRTLTINKIDKLFIFYNLAGAIIYIISSQNQIGAFIFQGGACIDSIILYFVFRYTIQSKETLYLITKSFSYCIIALLPFTIIEFYSAYNLFSFLGRSSIAVRDGEIRAAATFSHPILFGSFAAALFPTLWSAFKREKKNLTRIALASCIFVVYACSSSGPVVALAAVIFLLFFFKWKQHSSRLAWFILTMAITVHFIREKPIWHFLYMRLPLKASSTGRHRYLLIEAATQEFNKWWLLGYGDIGANWHLTYWPWTHARFTDITNHYLLVGVRGGFLTMVVFIYLCYNVVKTLGSFAISQQDISDQWLYWGFTVMMISHCLTFLSVAYFGQITMLLFLTIAVSSFAYDESKKTKPHDVVTP